MSVKCKDFNFLGKVSLKIFDSYLWILFVFFFYAALIAVFLKFYSNVHLEFVSCYEIGTE